MQGKGGRDPLSDGSAQEGWLMVGWEGGALIRCKRKRNSSRHSPASQYIKPKVAAKLSGLAVPGRAPSLCEPEGWRDPSFLLREAQCDDTIPGAGSPYDPRSEVAMEYKGPRGGSVPASINRPD